MFGEGELNLTDPPSEDKNITSEAAKQKETKNETSDYGAIQKATLPEDENDFNKLEEGETSGTVLLQKSQAEYVKSKMSNPETLKPHQPNINICLWMFHLLEGVATVAAMLLLVTQILPLFLIKSREIPVKLGILNMALRIYISLFCLIFIMTETGAPIPLIRKSILLQPYLSRGFLYSFLGLICVQEAYSERVKDIVSHGSEEFHVGWAAIFMEATSWLMLSCGIIYFLMGICCLKRMRDRYQQREIDEWKRYREEAKQWKERFGK